MTLGFSDAELAAIADAFPVGPATNLLLSRAGYPRGNIPSMIGVSAAMFWRMVSQELEAGAQENGRERILAVAAETYPAHPVLGGRRIRSVLVVGAAPDGLQPLRLDRELAEAIRAVEGRGITVAYRPAADVTDLGVLGTDPPDLLHLACHGNGEALLFEGPNGARRVAIGDLLAILRTYPRFRGVYLASCEGAGLADRFGAVADQVVAFEGELPDRCALAFTAQLYRALVSAPDLRGAADRAMAMMVAARQPCRALADRIIVR